jgi:hypothetical protein
MVRLVRHRKLRICRERIERRRGLIVVRRRWRLVVLPLTAALSGGAR